MWFHNTETGESFHESEAESRFSDFLDEVYGDVTIGGLTYSHGQALQAVDPIAFRCGVADYTADFDEVDHDPEDDEDDNEDETYTIILPSGNTVEVKI